MPGDCRQKLHGGDAPNKHEKVRSATVTSKRSSVRTKTEKGESEKIVAWVESCHWRIRNENLHQRLKKLKTLLCQECRHVSLGKIVTQKKGKSTVHKSSMSKTRDVQES